MITSPATRVFLTSLIDELEQAGCSPILLRNFENFPEEIGNDLDVYVRPERLSVAFSILNSCARVQGGRVSHIHRRGYFIAIWICFPDCESPVHIDLYHGALTWHGLHFLNDSELIGESTLIVSAACHRVPAPCHEALISLLTSILWGGFFKQRYQDRLNLLLSDVAQHRRLVTIMERNLGPEGAALAHSVAKKNTASQVDAKLSRRLRRRLCIHSLQTAPLSSCASWLRYWFEELMCYIRRSPGMVIEYKRGCWQPDDLNRLCERIGHYFGATHALSRTTCPIVDSCKILRLRGKNHLILLQGTRFSINGKSSNIIATQGSPSIKSVAEHAICILRERSRLNFSIR